MHFQFIYDIIIEIITSNVFGEHSMKIVVCIGSSCHIKGSRQVLEQLQQLVIAHNLQNEIEFGGTFCMGKCQLGVCVTVDGEFYSVTPDQTKEFFECTVLGKLS